MTGKKSWHRKVTRCCACLGYAVAKATVRLSTHVGGFLFRNYPTGKTASRVGALHRYVGGIRRVGIAKFGMPEGNPQVVLSFGKRVGGIYG